MVANVSEENNVALTLKRNSAVFANAHLPDTWGSLQLLHPEGRVSLIVLVKTKLVERAFLDLRRKCGEGLVEGPRCSKLHGTSIQGAPATLLLPSGAPRHARL